jgi:hypothetical protein
MIPIPIELARQLAQPESTLTWETRPNVLDAARVPSDGVLLDLVGMDACPNTSGCSPFCCARTIIVFCQPIGARMDYLRMDEH